jgi:glycosyltransferase involved in cell wall biosynthesis
LTPEPSIGTDRRTRTDALRVAYVTTHFPRLSQTFIATEVQELERTGTMVFPVAMNKPGTNDLATEWARQISARTLYLKKPAALATAVTRVALRHPVKLLRLAGKVIASARLYPTLIARRLAHLCYATLAVEHCRGAGVRHLHAHDGQSSSTIAWLSAEVGNFTPGERWTWSFTLHGPYDFVDELNARLDLKASSAAFVACISDFTKAQLCRVAHSDDWDRCKVLRCGIRLADFPSRPEFPARDDPRVLIVGRLAPEKGHLILLRAVALLASRGVPIGVDVVGGGPFEPVIRRECDRLGISDRVTLHGEMPPVEVSRKLAETDVFCLPSFAEGLPISIMEAMAVGAPVVTTYIAGIPELAVDGVTALTVPSSNVPELADALQAAVSDEALRRRITAKAREAVEERHVLEACVAKLREEFAACISPAAPR